MNKKLKLKLTFIGILFFSCMNLNAQNFDLGIAAGFDRASLHLSNSAENNLTYEISSIGTYNINGYLSFKDNGFWGLSVEPGIIRKGWNQSYNSNDQKNKLRLYYLQIPILSDFYLSDRFFISIGPEIDYLISAKNKYDSNTQDIVKYLNRFELSGMIGISLKINEFVTTSLRYSHGLTEVSKDFIWTNSEIQNPDESKDTNRYFQIILKMRIKNWQ
ncbi:porin family protein [Mangrovibacterium diazotrophicum]|uniref:Outer membrane protein with beta-barrel domain n=1 Tax=Mangrovibacterium diazotrophicum TaxID=1261403 RepID=A0A419W2Z2_9BACT|nr:porin family protein [Mangrovibacterium diazotrophicum]RKD89857.1 outer membrane protein with beta-barrel domain [Mangrovibacterium diazotrophicum]